MARKEKTQSNEPDRLNLVVSRSEAEEKIKAQIDKGRQIINQLIPPDRPFFADNSHRDKTKTECNKWSSYNIELLKRLFSDNSIANGYAKLDVLLSVNAATPNGLRKRIEKDVARLESILERLELIPELAQVSQIDQNAYAKENSNGEKWYQNRTIQAALITTGVLLVVSIVGWLIILYVNKSDARSDVGATISNEHEISGDFSPATAAGGPNKPAMIDYNSPGSKREKEKPPPLMKRDETAIEPEIEKQESKSIYEAGEALLEIFKADSIEKLPDLPVIRTYWKRDLAYSGGFLIPDRISEIGRGSLYIAKFSFYYEAHQTGKYGFTVVNKRHFSHTDFAFGEKGNAFKLTIGGVDVVDIVREKVGQGVCNLKKGFHRVEFWYVDKVETTVSYRTGFEVRVLAPDAFDAVPLTKEMMLLKRE